MDIFGSFFRRRKPVDTTDDLQRQQENVITAASVEANIDKAGRLAVFARAQSLGWSSAMPAPLWVWNAIATELIVENEKRKALAEAKGATLN